VEDLPEDLGVCVRPRVPKTLHSVFHAVPDDSVRNWAEYKEFYEYYFHTTEKGAEGINQSTLHLAKQFFDLLGPLCTRRKVIAHNMTPSEYAVPDDSVRNWAEYKEFYEYYFHTTEKGAEGMEVAD
jgi:predicted alpha/beta hydrolase